MQSRRQLRHMVAEENAAEGRRYVALRREAAHPLRQERLELRFARERRAKRNLIGWVRRDIEVSTVSPTTAVGTYFCTDALVHRAAVHVLPYSWNPAVQSAVWAFCRIKKVQKIKLGVLASRVTELLISNLQWHCTQVVCLFPGMRQSLCQLAAAKLFFTNI